MAPEDWAFNLDAHVAWAALVMFGTQLEPVPEIQLSQGLMRGRGSLLYLGSGIWVPVPTFRSLLRNTTRASVRSTFIPGDVLSSSQ